MSAPVHPAARYNDMHKRFFANGIWETSTETGRGRVRESKNNGESFRKSIQCSTTYANHERQKMLAYGERVRRVEHGTLTPLVFTCTGGAGPSGTHFIKRLASKISDHRDMPYSQAVGWLRCRVSFALLRSAIVCLRGSRAKKQGASAMGDLHVVMRLR